jgi:circadian clock protein KaiC
MDVTDASLKTGEVKRDGKARTGVAGLDDILSGGFSRGHVFLLEGEPGAGKTTVALQFLLDGAARGERGLYITLSETEAELREGASSHGWTLGTEIEVFELAPPESLLNDEHKLSLLYSSTLNSARRCDVHDGSAARIGRRHEDTGGPRYWAM